MALQVGKIDYNRLIKKIGSPYIFENFRILGIFWQSDLECPTIFLLFSVVFYAVFYMCAKFHALSIICAILVSKVFVFAPPSFPSSLYPPSILPLTTNGLIESDDEHPGLFLNNDFLR